MQSFLKVDRTKLTSKEISDTKSLQSITKESALVNTEYTKKKDLVDFNKELLKVDNDTIKEIIVEHPVNPKLNKLVKVDLNAGKIYIDSEEIDLGVSTIDKSKLKDNTLRWINFRRHLKSYRYGAGSIHSHKILYGTGWQTTLGSINLKRIVLFDDDGSYNIIKSREQEEKVINELGESLSK